MKALLVAALALLFPAHAGAPVTQTWDELSTQTAMAAMQGAPVASGGYLVTGALPAMHPHAGGPAMIIGSLGAGLGQGGVPCISCVSGAASGDNIGLTGPSAYIPKNAVWQFSLSAASITYRGHCKMSWAIAAGAKVLDRFSSGEADFKKPGGFFLYGYNRNHPAGYSGPAVITGEAICNGAPPLTTKMSLYYE